MKGPGGTEYGSPVEAAAGASQATSSEPNLKARVFSGASWSFVDNIAQQVISLLVFVVLGRILAPSLFGIVSTAMVFVYMMRSTVLEAVATGTVTVTDPSDRDYDTCFWIVLAISCVSFLILNVAAAPLAHLYRIDEFDEVIRATSVVVLLFGLNQAHGAWARRNFQFRALAMRSTISTLVGGVVGIAVALAGFGIPALITNQVLTAVVSMLLLWRALPWRPHLRFSRASARKIMATALPLGVTQSLQFLSQNFDTALVTYFLGPQGGGLYAAAKRVTQSITIAIWGSLGAVTLPAFAEVRNDPDRFGSAVVRISSLVAAIVTPLLAGVGLVAPSLILVLFGPKWQAAAPIMTVLALCAITTPLMAILQQILLTFGRAKFVFYFTLAQVLLVVSGMVLFGRGPIQIALVIGLAGVALYPLALAMVARATPLPLGRYVSGVGRPLLCGAIMVGVLLLVPNLRAGPLAQLVVQVAVGAVVYLTAFFVIARDTWDDVVNFGRSRLPKRFQRREFAA